MTALIYSALFRFSAENGKPKPYHEKKTITADGVLRFSATPLATVCARGVDSRLEYINTTLAGSQLASQRSRTRTLDLALRWTIFAVLDAPEHGQKHVAFAGFLRRIGPISGDCLRVWLPENDEIKWWLRALEDQCT